MKYEYKVQTRNYKTIAIQSMFSEWKRQNPDEYIHVGVFNPSITCLDLDIAINQNLIREDTKLIFFENFKYLKNKEDRSEYLFKKKVMSHIPMVKKENVFFHFGELETMQLGGIIHNLCRDKIEKVNFMFLDFCGELNADHAKWLYDNRYLIADNSFQFYTICLQTKMRYDCYNKVGFAKEYWKEVPFQLIHRKTKKECSINMNKLKEIINFWQFNCSNILDTDQKKTNPLIQPIIYADGVNLMGIFNGQKKNTIDYLWKFYHGFLFNSFVEKSENIDDDGITWDSLKKSKNRFTDYEIMLFRDMPIPEIEVDEQPFINLVKNYNDGHIGKFGTSQLRDKILKCFPSSFFPNVKAKKFHHSALQMARCFMIFNKFFLGKIFLDKETGKYGKFIIDDKSKRRTKYKFEYEETKK